MSRKINLIVLLGPTASGKSDMAVEVAKILGSEHCAIVGCDASQVYEECVYGAGTVEGEWIKKEGRRDFVYQGIVHYGIHIAPFTTNYSVIQYAQYVYHKVFPECLQRNFTTIILTGGTGYYAQAVLEGWQGIIGSENDEFFAMPDWKLRSQYYQQVLIGGCRVINDSDLYNRPRVISALRKTNLKKTGLPQYVKTIGCFAITPHWDDLKSNIGQRSQKKWNEIMWKEFICLYIQYGVAVGKKGIEYAIQLQLLLGWITEEQFTHHLTQKTIQYAKKQYTWLKKHSFTPVSQAHDIILLLNKNSEQ